MGQLICSLRVFSFASLFILSACKGFEAAKLDQSSSLDLLKGGITVSAGADQVHTNVSSSGKTVSVLGAVDLQNNNVSISSYAWQQNGIVLVQGNSVATLNASFLLPLGLHTITLAVTDSRGRVTSDSLIIELKGVVTNPTPSPSPTVTPTPSPTTTPPPSPSPTVMPPPPSGTVGDVESIGLPRIPTNFNIWDGLVPSWGTGQIAGPNAGDNVGAFRFICAPSHEAYDDPIVYPGQPGASHLHQFFGNASANAGSTYHSLRTTGVSTCGNVNRSAYWIPAMMNGKGKVVKPDLISIYYKREPLNGPECATGLCRDIPRGLRYVFGAKMDGTGLHLVAGVDPVGYFNCQGPTARPAHYRTMIEAARNCPVGNQLGLVISAPAWWDGKNLDSTDHKSHMSYQYSSQHPYRLPTFTLGAWYTVDADLHATLKADGTWNGTYNGWHLSSDRMNAQIPGQTIHADWFGAWDDDVMKMWSDHCINKKLNCSGGDLGNGWQIKHAAQPYPNPMFPNTWSWVTRPNLVDPPPMPAVHLHH